MEKQKCRSFHDLRNRVFRKNNFHIVFITSNLPFHPRTFLPNHLHGRSKNDQDVWRPVIIPHVNVPQTDSPNHQTGNGSRLIDSQNCWIPKLHQTATWARVKSAWSRNSRPPRHHRFGASRSTGLVGEAQLLGLWYTHFSRNPKVSCWSLKLGYGVPGIYFEDPVPQIWDRFWGSKVVEPRQIVKTRGCVVTNKEYLQNPLVFFGETSTNKFAVRDFEAEHVEPYCAPMSDLCVNLITF